jgi:hypothetical protein
MNRAPRALLDPRSKQDRRRAIRRLVAAQLALLAPLLAQERTMRQTGGPGIIPFELAGTPERTSRILRTWGEQGRSAARRSLILDYPYLATYAPLQALLCTAAGDSLHQRGRRTAAAASPALAWGQLAAGAFDAIENTALLAILAGRNGRLPALARRCASAKFGLLTLGWAYILLALAARLRGE